MWRINLSIPSQNDKIFGKNQSARFAYKAYRDRCFLYMLENMGMADAKKYSVWVITRYYGKGSKIYDHANLIGGCKPVVDNLIKLRWIKDDSPKHFFCFYDQMKTEEMDHFKLRLLGVDEVQTEDLVRYYVETKRTIDPFEG